MEDETRRRHQPVQPMVSLDRILYVGVALLAHDVSWPVAAAAQAKEALDGRCLRLLLVRDEAAAVAP
jgi:hypothetical protein